MPDSINFDPATTLELPNPALLQDAAGATSTLKRVTEPAPANVSLQDAPENPTLLESTGASMLENTLFGKFFQPYALDDHYDDTLPGYDVNRSILDTEKNRGAMFSKEDADFLRTANSPEGYQMRLEQLAARDMRQETVGKNPLGLVGAVVDIPDIAFGGVGVLSKLNKMQRIGAGAAIAGTLSQIPNSTATTTDHVLDTLSGALAGWFPFAEAEKALVKKRTMQALKEDKPLVPSTLNEVDATIRPEFKPNSNSTPTFWNGVLGGVKKFQSFWDELAMLGNRGKDLADRVLGRPFDDTLNTNSASAYQRNFMADAQVSIKHVEDAMLKAGLFQDVSLPAFSTAQRNAVRAERERVTRDAQLWLHREWKNHKLDAGDLPLPNDPLVRAVVQAYHESQFAETILRRAQQAGVEGADGTKASRSYTPLVWNFDRIRDMVTKSRGRIREDDIAKAFGTQIVRQFGNFANSDAESIGFQFMKTLQGDKTGDFGLKLREWEINGLTKEEVINTMRAFGFQEGETIRAADAFFGKPDLRSVGDVTKSLRQRLDWDLDEQFLPKVSDEMRKLAEKAGVPLRSDMYFSLGDFIEPDLYKSMNRYTLEMTSRIGLAKAGYESGGALQRALDEAADEAMAAGMSPTEVRATLDHLRELALGRPIGDQMPEWVRTSTALGGAGVLGKSGIYNIGEYGTMAAEYGYKAVAKEFLKTVGKDTLRLLDRKQWEDLHDMITGRLVADGRFRPIVQHLEDNFESATGSFHETVQYAAQSVRFLNGSEYIRRHQINMFAGLYQKTLEDAVNGAADAKKLLLDQGMSEEMLRKVKAKYDKYGWDMSKWVQDGFNESLVDDLSTHALSIADSVVLAIRKGERPRVMDSMLGKVVFPFMSFVWSAHNKILRRHYHRDGVAGVAMVMAYQAPMAFLSAAAANVSAGKQWDEDFKSGVPKSLSSIGLFSIPYDLIARGRMGGSFPGFAPVNNAMALIQNPEASYASVQKIPFIGVFAPANLVAGAFNQGDN